MNRWSGAAQGLCNSIKKEQEGVERSSYEGTCPDSLPTPLPSTLTLIRLSRKAKLRAWKGGSFSFLFAFLPVILPCIFLLFSFPCFYTIFLSLISPSYGCYYVTPPVSSAYFNHSSPSPHSHSAWSSFSLPLLVLVFLPLSIISSFLSYFTPISLPSSLLPCLFSFH